LAIGRWPLAFRAEWLRRYWANDGFSCFKNLLERVGS
jgi:hypothetical protein